jgi:hypothetical protein
MISSSDRSRLCSIDRRKYKGQGPVKYNDVRMRERERFFPLSLAYTLFEDDELRAVADGQCPWALNTYERKKENRR